MSVIEPKAEAVLQSWPIRVRELRVLRRVLLTPTMLRLTIGGPNHVGFESHIADEHVKLLFPDPESGEMRVPEQNGDRLDWPRPMPIHRDYTVRRYDPERGEVDIDVVRHQGGIAATWAETADIGSSVWVAGPPRGVFIPDAFTWQAYLGDETALPAIARRLAERPASTRGHAVIEIQDSADEQQLQRPAGVEVRWLHRGAAAAGTTTMLADAARTILIPQDGRAYVWFGGEQSSIKPLRAWAKSAGLGKHQFDFTGYWRRGAAGDEVEHHGALHTLKHLLNIDH